MLISKIKESFTKNGGNIAHIAKDLGVRYETVSYYIRQYKLKNHLKECRAQYQSKERLKLMEGLRRTKGDVKATTALLGYTRNSWVYVLIRKHKLEKWLADYRVRVKLKATKKKAQEELKCKCSVRCRYHGKVTREFKKKQMWRQIVKAEKSGEVVVDGGCVTPTGLVKLPDP